MPRNSGNQSHQSLGLRLYQYKMKSFLDALEQHTQSFFNFHAANRRKQRDIALNADRMARSALSPLSLSLLLSNVSAFSAVRFPFGSAFSSLSFYCFWV